MHLWELEFHQFFHWADSLGIDLLRIETMNRLIDDSKTVKVKNNEDIRQGDHDEMVIRILWFEAIFFDRSVVADAFCRVSGGREADGLLRTLMDCHLCGSWTS
jgi:hypothetical protein